MKKLKVFGNDYPTKDGTAVRDYLHVVDLADAHLKALQKLYESKKGFVCNWNWKGSSVLEVIHAFKETNDISIPYEFAPRRTRRCDGSLGKSKFSEGFDWLGIKTRS